MNEIIVGDGRVLKCTPGLTVRRLPPAPAPEVEESEICYPKTALASSASFDADRVESVSGQVHAFVDPLSGRHTERDDYIGTGASSGRFDRTNHVRGRLRRGTY